MKKVKVCADSFPPYQYVDMDGKIKGSDYELVMKKLRLAGYEPEIHIGSWDKIYAEFEQGEQDVLFQAQDTPERLRRFFFSRLLRYAVTEVVTANSDLKGIQSFAELQAYRIGVISDFANGPEIDMLPDSCKTWFADSKEILQAVCDKKVDFGICDQGVREYYSGRNDHLYSVEALVYKRPLYVLFRDKKQRDDFDKT